MNLKNICLMLVITGICFGGVFKAAAQSFDEMAVAGEEAMNAGRFDDAVRIYEKIVATGQTYENIMTIRFELGWAYYMVGSFDKAIPLFQDLSGARAPSEGIKQQSIFLMAECHARLADTLPEESPERKKTIDKSIELHTKFQSEYPESPNIPQSFYGRAYAYYLDGQYDKAESDLRHVIANFRTSSTAVDAYYLLGSVYSQQGLALVQDDKRDQAKPFLDRARELFNQLASQEGNLAMANDSIFSLAETWFSAGFYHEAIQYFREVRSKAEVMSNLRATMEELQTRFASQMAKKEDTLHTRDALNRVRSQAMSVSETPDRMISAYLRISDAFYRLERFDEVRIICRHLIDFTEGTEKMQAYMLMVNTYLEERRPSDAARIFDEFQQMFGTDSPMAQSVNLAIGQLYMMQGDLEAARAQLERSVEDYPEATTAEDALYLKLTGEYMDELYAESIATTDNYAERFPEGKYLPTALYYKGMAQAALGEGETALATLSDVLERFQKPTPDFQNVDEVAYQKGALLVQLEKSEEAIKHFQQFIERYKDSRLRPHAMYQLGIALNTADQFDEAREVLRRISTEHPDAEVAPMAMFQIGVMYFEREEMESMAAALRDLLEIHPESAIVPDVYFWLGFIARRDEAYDDAVAYFRKSLEAAPDGARAPECLLSIAQSLAEKAGKMGLPTVLPQAQREIYSEARLTAARTMENLMVQHPGTAQSQEGIPGIAQNIFELVRYKMMSDEEALAWFREARERNARNPAIQAQLAFSQGSYQMRNREQAKALQSFNEALAIYPNVSIPPEMLSDYADALKDAGELAQAEGIYNKILEDFPDSERAQAPAWFGLADIKYLQENYEEARLLFNKVLEEFPWYEEGRQGLVKLATILEVQEKYTEAEQMFENVFKEEKGAARIGASLGVARSQLAQAERARRANDPGWQDRVRVASENLTKITVLFEAYPEYVSEAYWHLGRSCELVGDVDKAREMYRRVVEQYPNFPSARPAGEQLKRLGG